jgi:hypothetical protein
VAASFGLKRQLSRSSVWVAHGLGATLFVTVCISALQGIVYNIRPLRTKDKPYLDVISESTNNPRRLTIDWVMIDPFTLPPSSIIPTY